MPQPSIFDDPIRHGYDYNPYSDPFGKEDAPEVTFDLNSLDLTIDDFQEVSKGKYNAGNLVLTEKGKLDIANNHRHFTILNGKEHKAGDTIAIRIAFVKALENAGVTEDRMVAIRERLGLGKKSLLMNNNAFTPLTRQEVRKIIDQNIDIINASRAEGTKLRTQEQLQAGLNKETKAERSSIRKTINRALEEKPIGIFDEDFLNVVKIFFPDPDEDYSRLGRGDLLDMKEFAEQFRSAVNTMESQNLDIKYIQAMDGNAPEFVTVSNSISVSLDKGDVLVQLNTSDKTMTMSLGKTVNVEYSINQFLQKIAAAAENLEFAKVSRAVATEAVTKACGFITADQNSRKAEQEKKAGDGAQAVNLGFHFLEASEKNFDQAVELVMKHGIGLTPKGLRLLAATALTAVCNGMAGIRENADNIVKKFAKDIQPWGKFKAGDARFAAVDDQLRDYAQGLLDDYLVPEKANKFNKDGLFESFITDANRAIYKFGDETFHLRPADAPEPVLEAFENAVKPAHRKALSTLMNQMIDVMTECLSRRAKQGPTNRHPNGLDLSKVPGLELFVRRRDNHDDSFYYDDGTTLMDADTSYALEMSADGNTATMTVTQKGSILFNVNQACQNGSHNNHIGSIKREMVFTLDLSTDKVQITDLHLSQDFDAMPPDIDEPPAIDE